MIDQNTFNFDNIGQEQKPTYSSTQIDPSTFLQGDNAVLPATAGFGEISTEPQIIDQNNNLQTNTMNTNVIFGETLKTETQVPEVYGQTFQENKNIEGNNYFGDINTYTSNQVQENNIDTNNFISNSTNVDNNAIFGQAQVLPATTTDINNLYSHSQVLPATTTDINNLYGQTQEIKETKSNNNLIYGEPQVITSTDTNTFFTQTQTGEVKNQIVYGQTQIQSTEPQHIYTEYQTSGTQNINNINYGTTEIKTGTTEVQTSYTPIIQTQNQTQTTQQVVQQTDVSQYQNIQNIGQLNYETYPTSNVENIQTNIQNISSKPVGELTQFQQNLDNKPITSTQQNITTTETQIIQSPQPITQIQTGETNITTSPITETVQNIQNNIVTNSPAPLVQEQQIITQNYQNIDNTGVIQNQTQQKKISGHHRLKTFDDEDFKRGRPIYNYVSNPYTRVKVQKNQFVQPLYRVRDMDHFNPSNFGLSRLTPAISYNIDALYNTKINNFNTTNKSPIIIRNDLAGGIPYNNINNINNVSNQINNLNNNIGNNYTNVIGNVNTNINSGLNKLTKSTSYNFGPQSVTPLLNNAGFNAYQ